MIPSPATLSIPALPARSRSASRPAACAVALGAVVAAVLAPAALVRTAGAQCILANGSFEVAGSGGTAFGGWSQFGAVASSPAATHGAVAARVTGPGTPWGTAGVWQPLDTAPGEQWTASAVVMHSSAKPLTGPSQAILNIEWRDAAGNLISYESHAAADAATPPDVPVAFSVTSGPAPAGAVSTHFLLGVLNGPGEPAPEVTWDEATFESVGPPTPDELQWLDFPGGRTVSFAGRSWRVKGPGYYGPGPNVFGDTSSSVWVDAQGALHLTVRKLSGTWTSSELALEDALGYGDYVFTTRGRLDLLDPEVVFGQFLWQYGACYDPALLWWNPFNEIDVEFSRWGVPGNDLMQFVAQPFDWSGNIKRFDAAFAVDEVTSHAFRWLSDRVEYRSWRGGPDEEATSPLIQAWTYTGPHVPRPEQPRVHLNLWYAGNPPAADQEVVLEDFTFVPEGADPTAAPEVAGAGGAPALLPPWPNPARPPATIRWNLPRAGDAELGVYDVTGRLVRTLHRGAAAAGAGGIVWDGRDEAGRRAAAGVYFARLRAPGVRESRRLVLIR